MGGVSSRRAKDFPLFYIRFTKPKRIRGEGKEKRFPRFETQYFFDSLSAVTNPQPSRPVPEKTNKERSTFPPPPSRSVAQLTKISRQSSERIRE